MKILILSTSNDISTNKVIKWLQYMNIPFERYNLDEKNNLYDLEIDQFSAYWFRKGNPVRNNTIPFFSPEMNEYIYNNNRKIIEYLEFRLQKKKHINLFFNCDINKLIVLEIAKEEGLLVPNFKMCTNNQQIGHRTIYKSINDDASIYNSHENKILHALTQQYKYTEEFHEFSPTLFQEKIEKKYEIRTFYLDGKFFSMAIFSQQNSNTSLDYRNYDFEEPNRTVPFNIPEDLERKLSNLMERLNLKSGSIDLIVNPNNEYFFLEVNPAGQFGMISSPCNFNIEKEIVNNLTHE